MSDLQCPATIVLLTERSVGASELRELRLALVVLAADSGADSKATRLASLHGCHLEAVGGMDCRALTQRIAELADSYRGESVAFIGSEQAVCAVLGRTLPPAEPVTLAVDGSGWNVLSG